MNRTSGAATCRPALSIIWVIPEPPRTVVLGAAVSIFLTPPHSAR
jgi:hypothetical protein